MLLDEQAENLTPDKERIIKWATGALFAAGSDTVRAYVVCSRIAENSPFLADGLNQLDILFGHVTTPRYPCNGPGRT
jgi:hypothetical protein